MKKELLITSLLLLCTILSYAEGTREVAPNRTIFINGQETSDIAALNIGHSAFGNFANINNQDKMAQLYINIQNPDVECIYLGFSFGHPNQPTTSPSLLKYKYYIKDPAGNIIYESDNIDKSTANISTWEEAYNGPNIGTVQNGYEPVIIDSETLKSAGWSTEGDYYIQFEFPYQGGNPLLIDFWDITVVNCTVPEPHAIKGRLWSYNWTLFALNDITSLGRSFNGKFYVCIRDESDSYKANISLVDFRDSGLKPGGFSVAFNSFGTKNTEDFETNRKSVWNENSTIPEYPVFLNYPEDIYTPPDKPEIEFYGIKGFCEDKPCLVFMVNRRGILEILLDLDKEDGIYSENSADRLIFYEITMEEVGKRICIPWDRLDGLNEFVMEGTIPIQVKFQYGLVHFPIYDAEKMETGFMVTNIDAEEPHPLLYYDDSEILADPGTGAEKVMLDGCTMPCHNWTYFVNNDVIGYGNKCTINSWWFSGEIIKRFEAVVTIEDDENPSITCPDPEIDIYVDENCEYKIPDFLINLNPSDNCTPTDKIILAQAPAAGEVASGNTTVIITAEDAAGNKTLCELILNPIDTIAPIIMGSDTIYIAMDKDCKYIIPDVITGRQINENCLLDTVSQFPLAGEESEYGRDVVIRVNAVDVSGNTGIKDIHVIFNYTTSLTIECPTDITVQNNSVDCSAEVILPDPIVTGVCGDFSISNDYNGSVNADGYYGIGTTTVTYTVVDDTGNKAECRVNISVEDNYSYYIPNAFTPNGDGLNDRIQVFISGSISGVKEFEIYNRWGNRVYEEAYANAQAEIIGWTGTFKDKPMQAGIYVYKVVLELCGGREKIEHGTITLIE